MLITLLTSNLFSQVSLPYTANGGADGINEFNTPDWVNSVTITNFTGTNPGIVGYGLPGATFSIYNTTIISDFIGTAILQINSSPFNIDYTVNYNWSSNGTSKKVELLGSTDGINYISINNNVSDNIPLTFNNTTTDYTYIMVKFTASGNNPLSATLTSFSISESTTNVNDVKVSDNYNVYSYNKNLVVKPNDFNDYTINVYNLNGQVVLSKTTNGNTETMIDVSNGMYIVNVNDGVNSFNTKVIVE